MKKLNLPLLIFVAMMGATLARAQNNAELKGDYAFSFDGMTTGGPGAWTPFAAVGRFTSDGNGNLTNGELDTNGVGPMEKLVAQAFTGTYTIGVDHRGLMSLNIPGGGRLAFAMMANGTAKFIEIDAAGGHGTVGSGTIEKSDATSYSTDWIAGDYAFGVAGFDGSNNRTAIAGRFTANGAGAFSNGAADINLSGNFSTWNVLAGSYMVTDGATGRGMLNMPPLAGGAPMNLNFVFYVVNARKVFAMETDVVSPLTPLLNGQILRQVTPLGPGGGFSNASLNGGMVMYLKGNACALGGLLTADGLGSLTLTYDQSCGGIGTVTASLPGTYSVASNGRAAIRPGTAYVVAYLVSFDQAFILVPDFDVSFGLGELQAPGLFTNSSVSGTYAGSTTKPTNISATIFSGEFNADGVGNLTGTEDVGAPSGATSGAVSATYSVSSSPTNGRGTIAGSFSGLVYVISPSKFVVVSGGMGYSAISIFEH